MHLRRCDDCTTNQEKKLLRLKFAWALHQVCFIFARNEKINSYFQCEKCSLQQTKMAQELFIHKLDENNYELAFVVVFSWKFLLKI
jgi:hypothetical protein